MRGSTPGMGLGWGVRPADKRNINMSYLREQAIKIWKCFLSVYLESLSYCTTIMLEQQAPMQIMTFPSGNG